MSVSLDEVHALARLAKLRLSREEAEALRSDLNRILEHVHRLGDLEDLPGSPGPPPPGVLASPGTTGQGTPDSGAVPAAPDAPPTNVPSPETLSPDALSLTPEHIAPAWREGFFLVPPPEGVEPEGS